MKNWEQLKDEIRKVSVDKEMARSILKMAVTKKTYQNYSKINKSFLRF
jgi:hypothetical protein